MKAEIVTLDYRADLNSNSEYFDFYDHFTHDYLGTCSGSYECSTVYHSCNLNIDLTSYIHGSDVAINYQGSADVGYCITDLRAVLQATCNLSSSYRYDDDFASDDDSSGSSSSVVVVGVIVGVTILFILVVCAILIFCYKGAPRRTDNNNAAELPAPAYDSVVQQAYIGHSSSGLGSFSPNNWGDSTRPFSAISLEALDADSGKSKNI
jgi:hypothetical protein